MYQLQRANEGDRKMLMKALSMAYGRTGKRRRELLQPLISIKGHEAGEDALAGEHAARLLDASMRPSTSAGQPATSAPTPDKKPVKDRAIGPVKAQVRAYINDLPAQLRALVQSQITASPPTIARRNPRRLGVEIPELNTWMKPMPDVRVKNKLSDWYASLLSTVQPPLPDKEWDQLRGLALGIARAQPRKPRRTNLTPPQSVLEMVVTRGKLPDNLFRKDYAHNINPRYMQRLWAEVFSQCSLMKYDSANDKWSVIWGHHVLNDSKLERKSDAAATCDAKEDEGVS
jgi:hypothetical protein